jgi:hypothetical protein
MKNLVLQRQSEQKCHPIIKAPGKVGKAGNLPIRTLWPTLQVPELDDGTQNASASLRVWKVKELDIPPTDRIR